MHACEIKQELGRLRCAVIVPFYNNASTVERVLREVLQYAPLIVAVDDGSTDGSRKSAAAVDGVDLVSYPVNRGKGHALRQGFRYALSKGYDYAITIDADGQHFADDIGNFVLHGFSEKTLLVGERITPSPDKPSGNSKANNISNFWFKAETGVALADTQSGFRLYPLKKINSMHFVCSRYAFEVEVLVRAVWTGITVANIPVKVYYPPAGERVSHFRPLLDFFRISMLNTGLFIAALLYYYPKRFFCRLIGK